MMTEVENQQLSEILGQLKAQIEHLLVLLSQKERFVVERRFMLATERRFTLEEIGQEFNVTRERVRQIEKNALQKLKRNIENYSIINLNNIACNILKGNGGILREDILISKIIMDDVNVASGDIQFILSLDKRFQRIPNTIKYHPYVRFSAYGEDMIEMVCRKAYDYLSKLGEIEDIRKIAAEISKQAPDSMSVDNRFYDSLFEINKSFKVIGDKVGLITWRHIHPRTLRDKIYYILREKKNPLHFVEIGNLIMNAGFDKKGLNMQAVHNELIRHHDFVLIGRGIYALKEWGFDHGTVADVIESILKEKESLSEEEIIVEVLKRRQVKPITIILNLKNKPGFIRVGRKQYSVKKD